MMNKYLLSMIIAAVFPVVIASCQSSEVITKIEYVTLTRGYNKSVRITPDSLIQSTESVREQSKVLKRPLAGDDWSALVKTLDGIELPKINDLPSPSNRRTFDGARHSSIIILMKDGRQWQHGFDDEFPHEDLKPLMDFILRISNAELPR